MKRQILGSATSLIACLAIAAFNCTGPAQAAQKLLMGRTVSTTQITGLIAEKMGYFKEQGLDVQYKLVSRGNVALGALATGNLQFAESAHAPFLAGTSRGAPFVAVGVVIRGFQGKLVAAPKHANLKSIADFKGMHIGIQVGTGTYTVALMALRKEGLKPSDFKFTNIRTIDMPAAMAAPNNPFDAVIGWEPAMTRIVQSGHGKIIITETDFAKTAGITFPFLLSTTRQFRKEHPDVVQKVLNAYARAARYIRNHHQEALKIFVDQANKRGAKLSEDIARIMLFDTDRFGGVAFSDADMKDLQATRDFLMQLGKLKSKPDLSKVIDPTFAEKAEAALMN